MSRVPGQKVVGTKKRAHKSVPVFSQADVPCGQMDPSVFDFPVLADVFSPFSRDQLL